MKSLKDDLKKNLLYKSSRHGYRWRGIVAGVELWAYTKDESEKAIWEGVLDDSIEFGHKIEVQNVLLEDLVSRILATP